MVIYLFFLESFRFDFVDCFVLKSLFRITYKTPPLQDYSVLMLDYILIFVKSYPYFYSIYYDMRVVEYFFCFYCPRFLLLRVVGDLLSTPLPSTFSFEGSR